MISHVLLLLLGVSNAFAKSKWTLLWSDEFDGPNIDTTKWQYDITAWGDGNECFEVYTNDPKNSFIEKGYLHIKPSLLADAINPKTNQPYGQAFLTNGVFNVTDLYGSCTQDNNGGCYRLGSYGNIPPIMSASLRSYQKFSFTYGKVEIRARMPTGDWLWPAIWMLPEDNVYGNWPQSGEIDIVECRGNRNFTCSGQQEGISQNGATLHWGISHPDGLEDPWSLTHQTKNEKIDFGESFHTFVMEWTTNGLSFFVDNLVTPLMNVPNPLINKNPNWTGFWDFGNSVTPWKSGDTNPWSNGTNLAPFDKNFFFVMNVAVGGCTGYFGDSCVNGDNPKPWSNGDDYSTAMRKFYNATNNWLPTWKASSSMLVDYIRVYQKS